MSKIYTKVAGVAVALSMVVATATPAGAATIDELLAQIAQLQAQLVALQGSGSTTGTGSSYTFATDLTIGSTGPDVVQLQTILESKGFLVIPTGVAKGYFGSLTQSALGKYQASVGIAPPAGYFGPITRAHFNSMNVGTPGTGTGTGTSGLSGGEASLEDFDSTSEYSNETLNEGETAKVLEVEFEVQDADARIERIDIGFEAVTEALEDEPWNQIEEVTVYINGDEVASMGTDDEDDWSREESLFSPSGSRSYEVRFTGVDVVIEEGEDVSVVVEVTASDSIDDSDLDQSWRVFIPNQGIRTIDGAGIDQYTGDATTPVDYKDFTIEAADDGDLAVSTSDEDPDPTVLAVDETNDSDEYEVFVFELEADDANVLLNTMVVNASSTDSSIGTVIDELVVVIDGQEYDTDSESTSGRFGTYTFDFEDNNDEIELPEDEAVDVTVKVSFAQQAGNYAEGVLVEFGVNGGTGDVTAEGMASGDDSTVTGVATSSLHTLSTVGVAVEAVSTSAEIDSAELAGDNDWGVYTVKFDVTALEEDVYIFDDAGTTTQAIDFAVNGTPTYGAGLGTTTISVTSSASTKTNNAWKIEEGETETFTLLVRIDPVGAASGNAYSVELENVRFSTTSAGTATTTYTVADEPEFETDPIFID